MTAPLALALICCTCVATIAVELGLAALLFGVRDRRAAAVVALAQVVTNPVVELGCLLVGWSPSLPVASPAWAIMLALELAAVAVEAWLYRETDVFERPVMASVVLNLTSFAIGCVVGLALA